MTGPKPAPAYSGPEQPPMHHQNPRGINQTPFHFPGTHQHKQVQRPTNTANMYWLAFWQAASLDNLHHLVSTLAIPTLLWSAQV